MKFKPRPDDAPVIGLNESGPDMQIIIADVGIIEYQRDQSEALADRLERAADIIRKQA